MISTLVRLALAEVGRLSEIELTPDSEPWAREAEKFVFSGELAEFARRYRDDLHTTFVEQHERIVAVAIVYPDPRFRARRIGAIVVDHRHRGRGFGTAVLQAIVSGAVSVGDTVCWLVHPSNVGMLTCSRRIEPTPDEAAIDDGYLMFVAP